MIWHALKEARGQKAKKSNLAIIIIWLDIANAYTSIRHKLIFFFFFFLYKDMVSLHSGSDNKAIFSKSFFESRIVLGSH